MRIVAARFLVLWGMSGVPATSAPAGAARCGSGKKIPTRCWTDAARAATCFALLERQHISDRSADELYTPTQLHGRNILVSEPQKYRTLIAEAHERGLKVYALLGSMYLRPGNTSCRKTRDGDADVRRASDFNAGTEEPRSVSTA